MSIYYEKLKQVAEQEQWLLFKKLLQSLECDQDDLNELLIWAVMDRYTDVVKLLLEDSRADPTMKYSHLLRWTAESGQANTVQLLLEDGRSDPAAENSYALRRAIYYGYTDIVKLLLEDGRADRNVLKEAEYEHLLEELSPE